MNKSYCSLAFNHISVRPDGIVRLCCNTRYSINDDSGTPYNLGIHDIDEILNSNYYKNVRKNMLEGNTVKDCASCTYQELYTNQSPRTIYNQVIPAKNKNIVLFKDDIVYLDLRFGNLCNLKCMSCGPHSSSQIDKETKEISVNNPDILEFHEPLDFDTNSWYKTETFHSNLQKIQNSLTTIYLTGGEPTIVEENFRLMNSLIEQGTSKKLTLKFSTNLTNVNPEFINQIKHFHHVILLCSIDGTELVQEYLRYPSKWNVIDKNFKKLHQLDNVKLTITPVVQNINLEYLPELFEYAESINRQKNKSFIEIYPQILHGPAHLNLLSLPIDYRKYCWNKIENWLQNCHFQNELFHEKIKQIKNICHDTKFNRDDLVKLKQYIELYSSLRTLTLEKVNIKLHNILNNLG